MPMQISVRIVALPTLEVRESKRSKLKQADSITRYCSAQTCEANTTYQIATSGEATEANTTKARGQISTREVTFQGGKRVCTKTCEGELPG